MFICVCGCVNLELVRKRQKCPIAIFRIVKIAAKEAFVYFTCQQAIDAKNELQLIDKETLLERTVIYEVQYNFFISKVLFFFIKLILH